MGVEGSKPGHVSTCLNSMVHKKGFIEIFYLCALTAMVTCDLTSMFKIFIFFHKCVNLPNPSVLVTHLIRSKRLLLSKSWGKSQVSVRELLIVESNFSIDNHVKCVPTFRGVDLVIYIYSCNVSTG